MKIHIHKISANALIGIYPQELKTPQTLLISITIELPFPRKTGFEDLEQTVDYDSLTQRVKSFVESNPHGLLEDLAKNLILKVFKEEKLTNVELKIEKPEALKDAETVYLQVNSSEFP